MASLKGATPVEEPAKAKGKAKLKSTGSLKSGKLKRVGHEEPRLLGSDRSRFKRKSTDTSPVLVLGTGDPVELAPGKLFVLGRDPRASLVVRTPDISRQHAEIDWDDNDPPRPLLNEIRSRNGTFLNGARLAAGDPRPLRSGDEIRLGASFRLIFLDVTPRDLRLELQERGQDDTRVFKSVGGEEDAPPEVEGQEDPALGDLVAAALGEADLTSLDSDGDFAKQHGKFLVKRLYTQRQTGVLTVYDQTDVGEMILVEGRCRHARLGMLVGREALEYVARLDRGRYRFKAEPFELLADAGEPSEVDEHGLSLSGEFRVVAGAELVRDLISRRVTGVLTVFDSHCSGQMVFLEGISQEAAFGRLRDREAIDSIVRLRRGVYRFRPGDVQGLPPTQESPAIYEDEYPTGAFRGGVSPTRTSPRPGGRASPLRGQDDEGGVLRRASQPVRRTRPLDTSPATGSRRKPPPPPRRRPPPPAR